MAILVPSGVLFAWPSTHASIPSGFVRETALDGYYLKGAAAGADPGVEGGSATHTHTSPGHTHTVSSHSHQVTGNSSIGISGVSFDMATGGGSSVEVSPPGHVHSGGTTTGSASATLTSTVATFSSGTTLPSYANIIFIRSLGSSAGIPDGVWAWWDDSTEPTGWDIVAATSGRYLRGATAGANGGGTGGGGSHSHSGVAHTHSIGSHNHSGGTLGSSASFSFVDSALVSQLAERDHTHSYTVIASSGTQSSSTTSSSTGSTTLDPSYTTLAVLENTSNDLSLPEGIIGLWLGLRSNIPAGWVLCDGSGGTVDTRGKFVKSASSLGAIATTGGSATHDHTNPSGHTHTTAHSHPLFVGSGNVTVAGRTPGAFLAGGYSSTHNHNATSAMSSASASGSGTQTVDLGSSEPLHKTVLFIKFTGAISVDVTSPTNGGQVTAPGFEISWSLSDTSNAQATRRVRIYESDDVDTTPMYDSGTASTSTTSMTLPTSIGLRTGRTYYIRVTATDSAGDPGDSPLSEFSTNWTPPSAITGLVATPVGGV